MTMSGSPNEVEDFAHWWQALPHPHKVVIAGNHDWLFQREPKLARSLFKGCMYLEDSGIEVLGLRIYGSPWQPWFLDWAFNLERGPEIRAKWDIIPKDMDILITHGPPWGIGDQTARGEKVGCRDLLDSIEKRIRPKWHIFGHIHEGYGVTQGRQTTFVNASSCNQSYEPVNAPLLLEF
jgi:Icc-related predicted phosphoesterase